VTSAGKLAVLCLTGLGVAQAADPPDSRDFFEKRIRPVFARNCNACHGTTRMGGLDMTSRESLLQGGASGPSLVPGKSDQSCWCKRYRISTRRSGCRWGNRGWRTSRLPI
jgi:mono/diheme cytochrome c family protein